MKAARIHKYGSPDVIVIDDIPRPDPGRGEVRVHVKAAGVAPWDALIRENKSVVPSPLPTILGSDLSGVIDAVGPEISGFAIGDEVYGVTNPQFIGAYTEYAIASAGMIAPKPLSLSYIEAASVPVVAVTAWQMLFEYGKATEGQSVLILGGAGNVGAYAVQMAKSARLRIIATAGPNDVEYVRRLGADTVVDYRNARFEDVAHDIDVVVDTVGGQTRDRALNALRAGGILVTVVSDSPPPEDAARARGVRTAFFLAEVTASRLKALAGLFDNQILKPQVGSVLPLDQVRKAHEMLAGAPHARGKIVLRVT